MSMLFNVLCDIFFNQKFQTTLTIIRILFKLAHKSGKKMVTIELTFHSDQCP